MLYIAKLKEIDSEKFENDEKLLIYAEYLAFDQIYREFKIDREVLESSLIKLSLNINYT